MLDKICAQDFIANIGQLCRLTSPDGYVFEPVLDSVSERTNFKRPQDMRSPFTAILKGPLEPSFIEGTFQIEIGAKVLASNVHILRVQPPWGMDLASAYYQIVFG